MSRLLITIILIFLEYLRILLSLGHIGILIAEPCGRELIDKALHRLKYVIETPITP
jgi:hypothetical protein